MYFVLIWKIVIQKLIFLMKSICYHTTFTFYNNELSRSFLIYHFYLTTLLVRNAQLISVLIALENKLIEQMIRAQSNKRQVCDDKMSFYSKPQGKVVTLPWPLVQWFLILLCIKLSSNQNFLRKSIQINQNTVPIFQASDKILWLGI